MGRFGQGLCERMSDENSDQGMLVTVEGSHSGGSPQGSIFGPSLNTGRKKIGSYYDLQDMSRVTDLDQERFFTAGAEGTRNKYKFNKESMKEKVR